MLEVKNITHFFKGLQALNDVSFTVEKGSIFGVIGPNGAGKSTLFNCITNYYTPSSGKVFFEGQEITGIKPHKIAEMGITRTFQHTQVFPNLSVVENVRTGQYISKLKHSGRSNDEWENEVERILQLVDLVPYRDMIASNLSMGDQTRLAIGIALATEAKLMLLDEPAAGMNPEETKQLMNLLRKIREEGVTIILIEHDMKAVMGICERLVVLEHGVKIAEGTPEEIRKNPQVIKAYLGSGDIA